MNFFQFAPMKDSIYMETYYLLDYLHIIKIQISLISFFPSAVII